MARPTRHFEWHRLLADAPAGTIAVTRDRLRVMLLGFVLAAVVIWLRAVQLEFRDGADFRAAAAAPIERTKPLVAARGRILARDGTVLAQDRRSLTLAVHYRWLQQPADATWLRQTALRRLPRAKRRDKQRLAIAEQELLAEREDLQIRLVELCSLVDGEWQARATRIQHRVSQMAERVNRQRRAQAERDASAATGDEPLSWSDTARQALEELLAGSPPERPQPVVVAEQEAFHPLLEDLPAAAADEIRAHPENWPGVRVEEPAERHYPMGMLAAHLVGHLGRASNEERAQVSPTGEPPLAETWVGRLGIERQYETALRGMAGLEVETLNHRGRLVDSQRRREPKPGQDLRLSIDATLQRTAEALLDQACAQRNAAQPPLSGDTEPPLSGATEPPLSGAIVVLDIVQGDLLVAASAPRFDPQWFVGGDSDRLVRALHDPARPLFDRVTMMALPPGSVFKTVTALALLEQEVVGGAEIFHCRGYLHAPDRQRCLIYRRQGVGHGDLALPGALAQSCNVYFFHFASRLGPTALVGWARRCGFGRLSGVDLPDEAAGHLPKRADAGSDTERMTMAQGLAIGQGQLTATPLQVARLMALVANGGRLIVPRVVLPNDQQPTSPADLPGADAAPSRWTIQPATLATVRQGLRLAVTDPEGTAFHAARLANLELAGKTGTAQTQGADHAWFAGYAPAESPRVAFSVVVEHGGNSAQAARVARDLVTRMQRLGYFSAPVERTAERD